ncbi:MAG: FAD binding domain-containing protein [Chloroflexota bacterium]
MSIWKTYYLAESIPDALQALAAAPGENRLVAGGTDLLLDLQQGRHAPVDTLVDVSNIPEMRLLEVRGQALFVGAAVPLNRVAASPLIYQHAQALHEAAGLIGGPQVRNTATLGGNVAHALPAGDGAISMLALGAEAEVASRDGRRRAPLGELYRGPGRSALHPQEELLVGFHLPLAGAGDASAFRRVMRPQGVAIAILNMGVWVRRQQERILDVRIAVGPAGPLPLRARAAEQVLRGQVFDAALLAQAVQALLGEAHFRTSPQRATAEYRRHTAQVLLQETFDLAWQRAGGTPCSAA